ncbi:MAG: PIF1 family DEAD/DEAH box helicase [Candidatus Peregrinibacteria bacterium]|nr:PIF1 family DEAD/DEAH box helicase [Candidatus Peregrinibacteria bacterium]
MKQDKALEILKQGHHVFLTGAAGTGKTFLLNEYINHLKDEFVTVGITASTGIAATHLNGVTIHSWAGFGIKDELTQEDIQKLLKKNYLHSRFEDTEVLIIDEVSMLHAHQLDMVDQVCRSFKQNDMPFGGIQLVLCGDFFQLSPVRKDYERSKFVNESYVWNKMDIKICYLDKQYRQADKKFLKILSEIRSNSISAQSLQLLEGRIDQTFKKGIQRTKLYTHNRDVDAINSFELDKINEEPKVYQMTHKGIDALISGLKRNCLAHETLILKKGALVMFVKNGFGKGYVNGTLGEVIDFDEDNYPIIKTYSGKKILATPTSWKIEENDEVKAEINQIPLRLAWAITVHKSQGMSLDAAEIDLSKTFTHGMGYVALSRVKSLKGIKLIGINRLATQVDPYIQKLDQELKWASEEME